jgi:hypothetical protein
MNDRIQKQISRSLRQEARSFVRGIITILPVRNLILSAEREQYILEEKDIYDAEVASMQNKKINAIMDKLNLQFGDEWQEWAKSLYIDDGDKLTSTACAWKCDMSWAYDNELEKIQIIARLVRYKARDRARGRGDIDQDLRKYANKTLL